MIRNSRIELACTVIAILGILVSVGFAGDGDVHMPFGKPDVGIAINHIDYVCGYKNKMRCSLWVAYRLTPESFKGKKKIEVRPSVFQDPHIKERAFKQAAGDAIQDAGLWPLPMISQLDAIGGGAASEKETYSIANMGVQKPNKKTRALWKQTEMAARQWAEELGEVFVVAGPVIGPEFERTRPGMMAIPDAFFKIIVGRDESGVAKAVSYKIPQEGIGKLSEYVTSVDALEADTGINFLKNLDDELEDEIEAATKATLSKPKPSTVEEDAASAAVLQGPAGQVWCDMGISFFYRSGHAKAGQGNGQWMDESTALMMGFKEVKSKKK